METLSIHTERLHIRHLTQNDLDDFHIYRSNPEVTKYQGFDVMTREQASEFIAKQENKLFGKRGEWVQYAIESKEIGRLIGDCAIKLDAFDERIAEVGMTVSHLHQQKGYAKEAFSGIMDFLFAVKNIHRIVETVDAENIASISLLESLKFRREGHFIENIFFKGNWGSEFQYAMLKREWLANS